MIRIRFKKHPKETGLYAVGHPFSAVDIKVNGESMGIIYPPSWQTEDNRWSIGFTVLKKELDDDLNCKWKWIHIKKRFDTENEAREFVKDNIETINKNYVLYCINKKSIL